MSVDLLMKEYAPLAKREARVYCRERHLRGAVVDDVESNALLGLYRAALRWRPGYFTSFKTYAKKLILGTILDGARVDGKRRHLPLPADIPAPEPREDGWDDAIRLLPPQVRGYATAVYRDGLTQGETAWRYGVSQGLVSKELRWGISMARSA